MKSPHSSLQALGHLPIRLQQKASCGMNGKSRSQDQLPFKAGHQQPSYPSLLSVSPECSGPLTTGPLHRLFLYLNLPHFHLQPGNVLRSLLSHFSHSEVLTCPLPQQTPLSVLPEPRGAPCQAADLYLEVSSR